MRVKKPKTGEAAVLESVMEYLTVVKRWPVWRRNVGGRTWQDKTGKKRVMKFGTKGQADCWGVIPEFNGRHFECELKKPGEQPTELQYAWLEQIRAAGGVAFWVDSLDMLERELKELGL